VVKRESTVEPPKKKEVKVEDKEGARMRAGQSLKEMLITKHKFRASTLAFDPNFRQPKQQEATEKTPTLRETLMPTFSIYSCDHLGLQSSSFTQLLNQKSLSKVKEALAQNKESSELDSLPYLFSDYVVKYDSKLNKV